MTSATEASFGRMRAFLFPIHRSEWRKFFPMMAMLCLICFNYTILRNVKDAIVVTAAGPEVLPFMKVWVVLPSAVLIAYLFTVLTNRYSQERVFYIMISSFIVFYALFAFVLYPYREALHAHTVADGLKLWLPEGFIGMINMIRYWSFTMFYVASELWSSMVMATLFWGFANEVTHLGEARRFYGVLSVSGNGAAIVASEMAVLLGNWFKDRAYTSAASWENTLQSLVGCVVVAGIGAMVIFWWMNRNVLSSPEFETLHTTKFVPKKKSRLSIKQSFAYLANSKYLIFLAVIVISYNLVINLVELVWKDKLSQLYPEALDYNNYMNHLTIAMCLISSAAAIFMPQIINRLGWTKTALITPIIMFFTCAGFFMFLFVQDTAGVVALLGASPLAIAVFFGAAQNCLSKAAKFSVFDATKEMAFIPLDHNTKLKGKAAIDGVGSRLGKSGGSLIHQGLLMVFVQVSAITPYIAAILFIVIGLWIVAAKALGERFNDLVVKQPEEDFPVEQTPRDEPKAEAWQLNRETQPA